MRRSSLLAALVLVWACGSDEPPDIGSVPEYPTYDEHIRPFLADHCLLCHGDRPRQGAPSDFRLDVYEDVDGKLGAKSMAEAMADMVERGKMPPDGTGVGPNARKMFRRWADLRAPKSACTPSCEGLECGDDGCGGSCGTCEDGLFCRADGRCRPGCQPDCSGKSCGDDGCGGSCGTCEDGLFCVAGQCSSENRVSVSRVWNEVISVHCISCHGGAGEGGLAMGNSPTSFLEAVVEVVSSCGARPYVVPGSAEESYLVHKVEGRPGICGDRMPDGRPPLTAAKIELLRTWIDDGARE